MAEHINGADHNPATDLGLAETIQAHSKALQAAAQLPDGRLAINITQMFCNVELARVRIDVMFELLVAEGLLDPAACALKLKQKLLAEIEALKAQPKVAVVHGTVPRNG